MTTNDTVGLSLKESLIEAEAELALSEESTETDISVEEVEEGVLGEQPTVETETDVGLFDDLVEQDEQPEGDSFTVTVNGVEQEVALPELISGYMRQADYTQKTQDIAAREREAEKWLTLGRALEERPVETIRQLYTQINQGQPIGVSKPISESPVDTSINNSPDVEALIEARVAEALANDPRLVAIQKDSALAQINDIFDEIEKMYKVTLTESDKQLTLQTAQDMDTTDLKFVFGGLMSAAQQRKLDLANAKRTAPTTPQIVPEDVVDPIAPGRFKTFRSALEHTLAEQGE
jgi:hypothetical protein